MPDKPEHWMTREADINENLNLFDLPCSLISPPQKKHICLTEGSSFGHAWQNWSDLSVSWDRGGNQRDIIWPEKRGSVSSSPHGNKKLPEDRVINVNITMAKGAKKREGRGKKERDEGRHQNPRQTIIMSWCVGLLLLNQQMLTQCKLSLCFKKKSYVESDEARPAYLTLMVLFTTWNLSSNQTVDMKSL